MQDTIVSLDNVMSSFLQRLKKKDVIPANADDHKQDKIAAQNAPAKDAASAEPVADQLHVDIYKMPEAIIIYAQIAGASVHDYSVQIEGDGDIVTIKGQRNRPTGEHFENVPTEGKEKVLEECSWGRFYRQVILPSEVDPTKTVAKMREGVLMLYLPLKINHDTGVKIQVVEV